MIPDESANAPLDGVALVREMAELVLAEAPATERARTLSAPLVQAMFSTGLAQYMNPAEAGGAEPDAAGMIETWLEAAALDGSFGWTCLANLSSTAAAAAYLPAGGFTEIFGNGPAVVGGQYAPNGRSTTVPGGIRLTGEWNFGSGTGHAAYIAAGYLAEPGADGAAPQGYDLLRVAFVPRAEVTFTDGWHVQGLRGTGSFDYRMTDVFVPAERTFPLLTRQPQRGRSTVFRMGLLPITAAGHAAWALGVSRSMLDDVEALAASRVRMGDSTTLAHRTTFQRGIAEHRMRWRAAHLLVHDTFAHAQHAVESADGFAPRHRADVRAAAVFATDAARQIAEWAHLAAGTAAIREGSRLERAFRDVYTGTQHVFINDKVAIEAAQIWLGIVDDHPGL